MRVLPVNYVGYQSRTNSNRPAVKSNYCQTPVSAQVNPNFKSGGMFAAGIFGAILGGAALIFAAPVAVVAGAAALGALGGATIAEDQEPLNDLERYKYTHEC